MIDLNILKQKNKSDSLEYIYKEIGDFILDKEIRSDRKYKIIDKLILDFINDKNFIFSIHVGLLTATHRFKHKLRNRKLLWEKTIEMADFDKLSDSQIKSTLNGLE